MPLSSLWCKSIFPRRCKQHAHIHLPQKVKPWQIKSNDSTKVQFGDPISFGWCYTRTIGKGSLTGAGMIQKSSCIVKKPTLALVKTQEVCIRKLSAQLEAAPIVSRLAIQSLSPNLLSASARLQRGLQEYHKFPLCHTYNILFVAWSSGPPLSSLKNVSFRRKNAVQCDLRFLRQCYTVSQICLELMILLPLSSK